ncbi:MAG: hypothetical protein JNL81_07740 [Hyphomonadaceae bacterium]|nr:hypothetical protein [Hyphomonadaceae bacterium]
MKIWMWCAWAGAVFAAFAATFLLNLTYVYGAQFVDPPGPAVLVLARLFVSPALTIVALVIAVVALVFMLFRRFPRILIVGLALVALMLFAHAGVEAYRLAQAR